MTKTRALSLLTALAATTFLTACGGGGSISGSVDPDAPNVPGTPGVVADAPKSVKTADLVAFAQANGDGEVYARNEDLTSFGGEFEIDGKAAQVGYVSAEGSADGVVALMRDGEATDFRIYTPSGAADQAVSGFYDGGMTVEYQTPGSTERQMAEGRFGFEADARSGEVFAGGMANGDMHSVEVYADGRIKGGTFSGQDVVTVLRESATGSLVADNERGQLNGRLVNTGNSLAGFGTITADNGQGFTVNGGFATTLQPE